MHLPAHTPPRLAECSRRRSSRGGRSLLRPDYSRQTSTATLRRYAALCVHTRTTSRTSTIPSQCPAPPPYPRPELPLQRALSEASISQQFALHFAGGNIKFYVRQIGADDSLQPLPKGYFHLSHEECTSFFRAADQLFGALPSVRPSLLPSPRHAPTTYPSRHHRGAHSQVPMLARRPRCACRRTSGGGSCERRGRRRPPPPPPPSHVLRLLGVRARGRGRQRRLALLCRRDGVSLLRLAAQPRRCARREAQRAAARALPRAAEPGARARELVVEGDWLCGPCAAATLSGAGPA